MNLNRNSVNRKIKRINSPLIHLYHKLGVNFFKAVFTLILFVIAIGIAGGYGAFQSILDKMPPFSLDEVSPEGYASTMYDSDGNAMLTLVQAGSNRTYVTYDELPANLTNAFIAIEDERFRTHNGVDVKGIFRAGYVVLSTFRFSEGASTITQQLIKNNVFSGGAETSLGAKVERKIQEQYYALELEEIVGKEWILENYLNTINLGNNTLGVQAAARRYFNKSVSELTLSECAVIAAITQNPSAFNPIRFPENNQKRQQKVLNNMLAQKLISQEEYDEAYADDVYSRVQNVSNSGSKSAYTYFEDAVIEAVITDLQDKLGYSQTQAYNKLYSGGLNIYTTQNTAIQTSMDKYVNDPANYPVTRYTCKYYLQFTNTDGKTLSYSENDITNYYIRKQADESFKLLYDSEDALRDAIREFKESVCTDKDTILEETITPVLEPQVSMTIIDNRTGYVVAITGGRGAKNNSRSLNRATDSTRSPGSCFKVLADFAPAIDLCGDSLASVYYDSPMDDPELKFSNWWGDGYVGYANIRQGIMYSMNLVATKCLVDTVTPGLAFKYVNNFGITTLVESKTLPDGSVVSDIVPSICLGGLTNGVTNLELTAAYESIANGGVYTEPIFYTKITDTNGKVLLTREQESHVVLKPSTATLLTKAMEHVFDDQILYTAKDANGNSIPINPTSMGLGLETMTCAGKSGSTTSQNDVWFEGYTPYYTCGIWSGYDDSVSFGSGQTFHKEIWKAVMDEIHVDKEVIGFTEYAPLETARICSKSGLLAIDGVCNCEGSNSIVYDEYFAEGTAPKDYCNCHMQVSVCRDSNLLSGADCPGDHVEKKVYMLLNDKLLYTPNPEADAEHQIAPFKTYDEEFTMPAGLANNHCTIHVKPPETEPESESDSGPKKPEDAKKPEKE